jgi:hypothetical protein
MMILKRTIKPASQIIQSEHFPDGGTHMFVRKFSRQTFLTLLTVALLLTACNVGAAPAPTLDINAINTAVVGTTVAQLSVQFTQTALAVPPTSTSLPTNTPLPLPTFDSSTSATTDPNALPTFSLNASATPLPGFTQIVSSPAGPVATAAQGDACNNNVFEGDVTIPDGTILKPGQDFQKVWAIRNTGTCTWDEGYTLVFIAGDDAIDPYNFQFKKTSDFVSPGEGINLGINLTAPLKEGDYAGHWRMRNDQGSYFGTTLSVYITVRK